MNYLQDKWNLQKIQIEWYLRLKCLHSHKFLGRQFLHNRHSVAKTSNINLKKTITVSTFEYFYRKDMRTHHRMQSCLLLLKYIQMLYSPKTHFLIGKWHLYMRCYNFKKCSHQITILFDLFSICTCKNHMMELQICFSGIWFNCNLRHHH
jgi:hypothetical protein